MEQLTLTTPEVIPAVNTTTYKLIGLNMQWEIPLIVIHLRGSNGELKEFQYGGPLPNTLQVDRDKALALMTTLNKANLSTTSLQKRVLQQLVTDGKLAGTITGLPD